MYDLTIFEDNKTNFEHFMKFINKADILVFHSVEDQLLWKFNIYNRILDNLKTGSYK